MSLRFYIPSKGYAQELISENDSYIEYTKKHPKYQELFLSERGISFCELLKESVRIPTFSQKSSIVLAEDKINNLLKDIGLEIDMDINFIFTNGSDNIGLPYTKGSSIIFPEFYSSLSIGLIVHEIWHIISRSNDEIRRKVYDVLGFKKASFGELDVSNIPDYFINPDAIKHDYYFPYNEGGEEFCLFPMLNGYADYCGVKTNKEGDILEVNELYKYSSYGEFYKNISYNSHPEEVAAEHFRLLVIMANKYNKLLDYEIILRLRKVLMRDKVVAG